MKNRLFILFLFVGLNVSSQILMSLLFGEKLNSGDVEFGLEGGFNFESITNMESTNYRSALNLGNYFHIRLKNDLWLDTGTLVKLEQGIGKLTDGDLTTLGIEIHPEEGKYEQIIKNILIPAQLMYRFESSIYIEGGIQFALVTKAYVEFNGIKDEQDIRIQEENIDDINKINLGPIAGFGYQFKKGANLTVGVKYYYSMLDVYKNIDDTRNSSFFLKMNVPIGAGKSREARSEKKRLEEQELKNNEESKQ